MQGFIQVYGTHFVAGYTTAASYDALVTFRDFGSNSTRTIAAGIAAEAPIPQAGGAIIGHAGMGFSNYCSSLNQEQVLNIKVGPLGLTMLMASILQLWTTLTKR